MPRLSVVLLLALFALSQSLAARPSLPTIAPYGDPDATARPFEAADPLDGRQLARLDVRLADQPQDFAALATRGWLLAHRGERARALADIDAAIAAASGNLHRLRQVLWSAGWAAVALGDGALANDYWDRNLELTDSRPFWVSYSRAVAHGLQNDLDTATTWYAMAAAVMPHRFGDHDALVRTTRHWQVAERQQIDRVFAHWERHQRAAQIAAEKARASR